MPNEEAGWPNEPPRPTLAGRAPRALLAAPSPPRMSQICGRISRAADATDPTATFLGRGSGGPDWARDLRPQPQDLWTATSYVKTVEGSSSLVWHCRKLRPRAPSPWSQQVEGSVMRQEPSLRLLSTSGRDATSVLSASWSASPARPIQVCRQRALAARGA